MEKGGERSCNGKASFAFYLKNETKLFQTINLDYIELSSERSKLRNLKRMYAYQSVVFFEDHNFGGVEDLDVRDGNNQRLRQTICIKFISIRSRAKNSYTARQSANSVKAAILTCLKSIKRNASSAPRKNPAATSIKPKNFKLSAIA